MEINKAPEKLYFRKGDKGLLDIYSDKESDDEVEYTRTDIIIKRALKWYCMDCECNDNCKDTKCFFYREYERYLKGETNTLPPKISDRILNEDGRPSDNWRYRHFITKIQDAFIDKACKLCVDCIEDFMARRMEIWYEDSKKQTLENLRKALKE